MRHFSCSPAWPWQSIVFTVAGTTLRLEAGIVESSPVLLLFLHPLRSLPRIADGPHSLVELTGDVLDQGFVIFHLDMLEQLLGNSQLLRQLVHDGLVRQRFKQRLDHLVAPLQRAVGCRH